MATTTVAFGPVIGVIDDDPSVLKALTRLLRATGCGAVPFASAEQFLETYHEWVLDCLVVDVHFAGMSGLELAVHLRDAGMHFPIVFITAHEDSVTRDRIEASGQAYLCKPLEEAALFEAIHRVLARTRGAGDGKQG
jgi:FixJ family two-component response regulator